MGTQFRIRDGSDPRMYAPAGDLAHNISDLMRRASYGLDNSNPEPWVKDWIDHYKITNEDLCAVAVTMAKHLQYILDPAVDTPQKALDKAGLDNLNSAALTLFLAKLGQITICAAFTRIKEANDAHMVPKEVKELVEHAEAQSRKIKKNFMKFKFISKIKEKWAAFNTKLEKLLG